jgi:hypothetical protein
MLELRRQAGSIERFDGRSAAQLDEKLANNPQGLGFDKRNPIELCARRRHVLVSSRNRGPASPLAISDNLVEAGVSNREAITGALVVQRLAQMQGPASPVAPFGGSL